jgi:hypothetical protein
VIEQVIGHGFESSSFRHEKTDTRPNPTTDIPFRPIQISSLVCRQNQLASPYRMWASYVNLALKAKHKNIFAVI